jgi:hypothetical protein
MSAIFKTDARFLPNHVVSQVKILNNKVLDSILPGMLTEMKQQYGYQKDISEPIKPIILPMNVNNAGRKTLPPLTSVWGF